MVARNTWIPAFAGMTDVSSAITPAPAPPPASTHALLAAVNAAGGRFERVVITRNRRVLVSLGDRGRTLRLDVSFRDAPAEVLQALARMYGRSGARERGRARSVVRAFLENRRAEIVRPAPRRRVLSADRVHIDRLTAEFDRVNRDHFDGALPRIHIALSGRMRRRNGHFSADPLEIVVSRRLCSEAAPGEAEHTLRHEMIHLWQHLNGATVGHGSDFRRWAERLGVHPRAKRPVEFVVA